MGCSIMWPRELRFGTHNYCGLQLKHCEVEATIKKIKASALYYIKTTHQKQSPS